MLNFLRGWWCPKKQQFFRGLVRLQAEAAVACSRLVSVTFVRDSSHFSGAVTVRRHGRALLREDPFRRLGPAEMLDVGPGLFGVVAAPPGPVIQRCSGAPWPMAGF